MLQYRLVDFEREDGSRGRRVRPYLIDLGSTNKSYVNNKPIEAERFFELKEKVGEWERANIDLKKKVCPSVGHTRFEFLRSATSGLKIIKITSRI